MSKKTISLNSNVRTQTVNADKLLKHAQSVAEAIIVPAGIEFAQFQYNGKTYALEADVSLRVSELPAKVPGRVFRTGDMAAALKLKAELAARQKALDEAEKLRLRREQQDAIRLAWDS